MKYRKTKGDYIASNFWFNPNTCQATSYGWYNLVQKFGDKVILNDYHYSSSTIKHISKARKLLDQHGIDYTTLEAPSGLQDLETAARHYQSEINDLMDLIVSPKTKLKKNQKRMTLVSHYAKKLKLIQELQNAEI